MMFFFTFGIIIMSKYNFILLRNTHKINIHIRKYYRMLNFQNYVFHCRPTERIAYRIFMSLTIHRVSEFELNAKTL